MLLTVLNLVYKVSTIYSAITLQRAFAKREDLIKRMELEAGVAAGAPSSAPSAAPTTSSGEAVDSRSLAAQEGR